MSRVFILPAKISGVLTVPPSKSHSIRALLLATLAAGRSVISNMLFSQDTKSCIQVIEGWGVQCQRRGEDIHILSPGLKKLKINDASPNILSSFVGNSGTTLYFATALAALGNREILFDGDESIRRRSAKNLLLALKKLGAEIHCDEDYCAPYSVRGPIRAGNITIDCPTSQYLSALLVALSWVDGESVIQANLAGEHPYVDMTMNWLSLVGKKVRRDEKYSYFSLTGYSAKNIAPLCCSISGDYSSAAFFICAGIILSAELTLLGLDPQDSQADRQILDILSKQGARFHWNEGKDGYPQLRIQGKQELSGGIFDIRQIPDSLPILTITSCFARKETKFCNVAHARIKETDRIAVLCSELAKLQIRSEEYPDGLTIYPGKIKQGIVDSQGDHRLAMAFAIAALGSCKGIRIRNFEVAEVTYPGFYHVLEKLGAKLQKE